MPRLPILFSTLILLLPLWAHANVFKCTDPAGNVSFQEKPCGSNETSDEYALKSAQVVGSEFPLPEPAAPDSANVSRANSERGVHPDAPGGRNFCRKLVAQHKAEEQKIKAACKQARNTYCDQSAEGIEQTQERQFLRTASNAQMRNYNRNNATGTPLARMKEQLRLYGCNS